MRPASQNCSCSTARAASRQRLRCRKGTLPKADRLGRFPAGMRWREIQSLIVKPLTMACKPMSQPSANHIEYRGYGLDAVEHGPGWRVHILPGPRFLRTQPDHVSAGTKEEAFAKARAIIDHHLLGWDIYLAATTAARGEIFEPESWHQDAGFQGPHGRSTQHARRTTSGHLWR